MVQPLTEMPWVGLTWECLSCSPVNQLQSWFIHHLGRTADVESMLIAAVMNTFYTAPQTGSKYEIHIHITKTSITFLTGNSWDEGLNSRSILVFLKAHCKCIPGGKIKNWPFVIRISFFLISFHSERQQWIISPIALNRQKLSSNLCANSYTIHTHVRAQNQIFQIN